MLLLPFRDPAFLLKAPGASEAYGKDTGKEPMGGLLLLY